MEYKYISTCEEDTQALAENIESEKFPNMVICLNGDLGSGKTFFVASFAKSASIEETITSPTFNIVKEYDGELKLFHMDVYRLEDNKEDIGLEEYFKKGGVTIIEWADLIEDKLPKNRLDITIKIVDETKRIMYITPYGEKYVDLCEKVL